MFGFLNMMNNYEDRKVARFEDEEKGLTVSTCRITDSSFPFETAVRHPFFNENKWVVVEEYDNLKKAEVGHEHWIKIMTADQLPTKLVDVSSCEVAELCDFFDDDWRDIPSV